MKGIIFSVVLLFAGLCSIANPTDIVDSIKIEQEIEVPAVDVGSVDFDLFENDELVDTLLTTGSVRFSWSNIALNGKVQVRYKFEGDDSWSYSDAVPGDSGEITLEHLDENKFGVWSIGRDDSWTADKEFHTLGLHMFENVKVSAGEESAKLSWSVDYDVLEGFHGKDLGIIIKYISSIDKKRLKGGDTLVHWSYSEPFSLKETSYEFKELAGYTSYSFKVGLTKDLNYQDFRDGDMVWSEAASVKTERAWGLAKLLVLIGSLGFFIYGMKIMSEGLQQAAGTRLRSMLSSITSNRVKGVLTGFGITGIVQSSSVTTVMTVSFVNAGLMTLRQSAGVMMGANIGTTITAWIVLLIGFKVDIGSYAYMLIALAAPLMFINRGKSKSWASAILGFCILFIGLGELKDAVPELGADNPIVQFFLDFKNEWYGPMMFVFLGTLVTIVIQSSSAAMALTLTMVSNGTLPFEVACAMVLGENIGTTITAQLAAIIGNVHAKRAAKIHFLFNSIGVIWVLLIFPLFLGLIGEVTGWFQGVEFDRMDKDHAGEAIAWFHSIFNVLNVLLMIAFVPQLVNLAVKMTKSKGDADESFKLDYIGGALGTTAELCILEAKKEVAKFGKITSKMNGYVKEAVNTPDKKVKGKMYEKLEVYEEITDRVEVEIGDYLSKAARLKMSHDSSVKMQGMINISTDLERIGDLYFQMSKALERKDQEKWYFTPKQRDGVNAMIGLLEEAFEEMISNLEGEYGDISLEKAIEIENKINTKRDKLRAKYLKSIEKDNSNLRGALVYSNIFGALEKVGDHILSVSESVAGNHVADPSDLLEPTIDQID